MKEFEEAIAMGRANVEATKLTRRHCRHARIEMVGGNSPVGSMYDLPMGLLEVRCEHAPPPRVQGHQALELASGKLTMPFILPKALTGLAVAAA